VDGLHPRVAGAKRVDELGRPVRGGVVHEDDLEIAGDRRERVHRRLVGAEHVVLFVEEGEDDADRRHGEARE
jgi:hypothetical protein